MPKKRAMHHPRLGEIALDYVKMHVADDDKTFVAHLAPPGSELADRLAELVAEPDA
jgi:hypothetical protein